MMRTLIWLLVVVVAIAVIIIGVAIQEWHAWRNYK